MIIRSLAARFGGSAISNPTTFNYARATLIKYMPPEHEALYQEVIERVCKETYKFDMGYGRVSVFPKITSVGLIFKLPDEVQSILREMSKALSSLEGIKICEDLMVPVWHVSCTPQMRAAAIREAWAFTNLLSTAHPHGIRLRRARGLTLRNRGYVETTPRTISFIDDRPRATPTPDDL
jgi:hypothetical protein